MSNAEKDFSKFAYFRSRARNYAICMRPERRAIVDGEVVTKDVGLRIEFNNHFYRIEKTEDNENIIEFLRNKILSEKDFDPNKKMLFEEVKGDMMIPESEVEKILIRKNAEIAELKKQIKGDNKAKKADETKKV